jgi:Zn-finger nucleic acid-binding protein
MCRKLMNRSNFGGGSGVIIDVCGPDGVFFDRGELTRIVDFIEKGGWNRVKKREKERMQEEISALESRKMGALDLDSHSGGGLTGVIGFLASILKS